MNMKSLQEFVHARTAILFIP